MPSIIVVPVNTISNLFQRAENAISASLAVQNRRHAFLAACQMFSALPLAGKYLISISLHNFMYDLASRKKSIPMFITYEISF